MVSRGYDSGILDSTELYDPSTGHWRVSGPLPSAREGLMAGTMDYRVLVFLGDTVLEFDQIGESFTEFWGVNHRVKWLLGMVRSVMMILSSSRLSSQFQLKSQSWEKDILTWHWFWELLVLFNCESKQFNNLSDQCVFCLFVTTFEILLLKGSSSQSEQSLRLTNQSEDSILSAVSADISCSIKT